ncbi:Modification methylase RsrI [Methylobacterium cerastii]|uniref:Methyltransferase n=1 Tax=Methylobacterium cerastii TaxID=932741 RepID=A0ABQ4QPC5_9HYPH|nr:site-specific DNA-methyltransferase [Methylobacterium cerastii]GJD47148.1 Modification methylase RsrI [Methylobacterium cerastii]
MLSQITTPVLRSPASSPPTHGVNTPMNSLINADCIETMREMPASSVNLIITSPPYNAGKRYETDLTIAAYTTFANAWVSEIPRLLTNDGALWLNVGYTKVSDVETLPLTYLYHPLLLKHGLRFIQEVVWHYEGGMAYTSRFSHRTERWMWLVKNPDAYTFNLDAVRDKSLNRTQDRRNNPMGKNPTDYWYFNRVVGGRGARGVKTHPCPFPVPMLDRIVRACSHPNDVILDPFGGSGSTAASALSNDRQFISIEREPQYHADAEARITSLRHAA